MKVEPKKIKLTPVMKSVMIMALLFGTPPYLMPKTSSIPLMVSLGWLKNDKMGNIVLTEKGVLIAKRIHRMVLKDYKMGVTIL